MASDGGAAGGGSAVRGAPGATRHPAVPQPRAAAGGHSAEDPLCVELPERLAILPFRKRVLLPGAIIRITCSDPSRYYCLCRVGRFVVRLVEQELWQKDKPALIGIVPVIEPPGSADSTGSGAAASGSAATSNDAANGGDGNAEGGAGGTGGTGETAGGGEGAAEGKAVVRVWGPSGPEEVTGGTAKLLLEDVKWHPRWADAAVAAQTLQVAKVAASPPNLCKPSLLPSMYLPPAPSPSPKGVGSTGAADVAKAVERPTSRVPWGVAARALHVAKGVERPTGRVTYAGGAAGDVRWCDEVRRRRFGGWKQLLRVVEELARVMEQVRRLGRQLLRVVEELARVMEQASRRAATATISSRSSHSFHPLPLSLPLSCSNPPCPLHPRARGRVERGAGRLAAHSFAAPSPLSHSQEKQRQVTGLRKVAAESQQASAGEMQRLADILVASVEGGGWQRAWRCWTR
ncbi:unnamed protein product [Closterium sp. Naga37s-1]|nr:unnamed protein product [Closterium sp. Naga37s-1]